MVFILEALPAKHGDALLLHFGTEDDPKLAVIDGGPAGVFGKALFPRLKQIHEERGKPPRLFIDLGMVSHVDDDHIAGIVEMTSKMIANTLKPPLEFQRFWHNSFNDLLEDDDAEIGTVKTVVNPSLGVKNPVSKAVIASVGQGRQVRKNLDTLKLGTNSPFKSLIVAGHKVSPWTLENVTFTVVAPLEEQVIALQEKWAKELKAEKKNAAKKAEIAAFVDESVPNLSSIVLLVEAGKGKNKKRMLLTGDGRGDHTLEGLEKVGLVKKGGVLRVDVLKVPHHGSEHNVDDIYFERIVADHYVISADGKHDNPDVPTLEMISRARPDDKFTIHLTHTLDEFTSEKEGRAKKAVKAFFAKEKKAGRKYEVRFREKDDPSIRIEL